ncbi:hypothetical protein JG687_00001541 [Phytophthora cactorum]|uniref:Uncharacterized protein n=1 Tax=Phytophthora cactorum TaxID=29920 RepID=A0A8T1UX26_9STRA|nr:hypothetical protein GQ600_7152 [Phytophthora cactorum]KAG6972298.1 hypothetical protein JG687_00001541 [Phytophthora cactorum]
MEQSPTLGWHLQVRISRRCRCCWAKTLLRQEGGSEVHPVAACCLPTANMYRASCRLGVELWLTALSSRCSAAAARQRLQLNQLNPCFLSIKCAMLRFNTL